LCPDAAKSLTLREEVKQIAVRRPGRITIHCLAVGDWDPFTLWYGSSPMKRRDVYAPSRRRYRMKGNPTVVRREAAPREAILGMLQYFGLLTGGSIDQDNSPAATDRSRNGADRG